MRLKTRIYTMFKVFMGFGLATQVRTLCKSLLDTKLAMKWSLLHTLRMLHPKMLLASGQYADIAEDALCLASRVKLEVMVT